MATGRFAPSPSGPLHLGSLRTALVAWLAARSTASRFLVRIEDLDPVASRAEHEVSQLADLAAIGLDWDGEVVRQSQRRAAHDAAVARLEADGLTYPCFCTRREVHDAASAPHLPPGVYPGTCRDLDEAARARLVAEGRRPALRVRAGGATVEASDRRLGTIALSVDDFVVRRGDGVPAYNLAVVVDDADQGIEEVVRGDDLWATTPRQVFLARLLGIHVPSYLHVPMVVGPDGVRLAKRHGAIGLADLAARGVTPDEVRSVLAVSLGLAAPGERVGTATLVDRFDPDHLPEAPWGFDPSAFGGGRPGSMEGPVAPDEEEL